jgi:hypothetical protein
MAILEMPIPNTPRSSPNAVRNTHPLNDEKSWKYSISCCAL